VVFRDGRSRDMLQWWATNRSGWHALAEAGPGSYTDAACSNGNRVRVFAVVFSTLLIQIHD
jgi:hypothetical protein